MPISVRQTTLSYDDGSVLHIHASEPSDLQLQMNGAVDRAMASGLHTRQVMGYAQTIFAGLRRRGWKVTPLAVGLYCDQPLDEDDPRAAVSYPGSNWLGELSFEVRYEWPNFGQAQLCAGIWTLFEYSADPGASTSMTGACPKLQTCRAMEALSNEATPFKDVDAALQQHLELQSLPFDSREVERLTAELDEAARALSIPDPISFCGPRLA